MSEQADIIREGIKALSSALQALDAECVNWGEAENSAPTEKTFILHHAFLTACDPDVIRHLLSAPLQQETDKDGERYRWLRDKWALHLLVVIFDNGRFGKPLGREEALDDAIDAAIAALPQKDGMK